LRRGPPPHFSFSLECGATFFTFRCQSSTSRFTFFFSPLWFTPTFPPPSPTDGWGRFTAIMTELVAVGLVWFSPDTLPSSGEVVFPAECDFGMGMEKIVEC